jgi:hypothetical protein
MLPSQPIFRQIQVDTGQIIILGQPIPADVQRDLEPGPGPNEFQMKPGTFGRATSIVFQVASEKGPVIGMRFTYDRGGDDWRITIMNFTNQLGEPTSYSAHPPSVTWEDSQTRFRLAQDASNGISSTLTDLTSKSAQA